MKAGMILQFLMSTKPYFRPTLFAYLRDLQSNNNRQWFLANKARYESHVRDPMLEFIADFGPRLRRISRHYVADPRPVGGSMFRIYRDVRFSSNKSPYKTNVGANFHHAAAKDVHAPGFYLHLAPDEVFIASGVWKPDSVTGAGIREAIVARPRVWIRTTTSSAFKAYCELASDRYKRTPLGYDCHHPLVEDLKLRDFLAMTTLTEKDACSPEFMDRFENICEAAAPFMRFLTSALNLPW
jgi:uncharacterized protein (TIGR02453 family)